METKINYTLVGLFVLLLTTAGIIIPLWLTSGLNQQQYQTYLVVMGESVDGLSTNAAVKYNGVDVGYVRDIRLNSTNTQQVDVFLNIKQDTPITSNTTATLQSQGVTGVEYIGLKGGALANAVPLVPTPKNPYPQIKSEPSIRLRLDTALTQLMNNMNKISEQLDRVFDEKNAKLYSETLHNIYQFSQTLAENSQQFNSSMRSLQITLQAMSQTSQQLPMTAYQMQSTLQQVQSLTDEIKQNPSLLIRGSANPPLGPGERN